MPQGYSIRECGTCALVFADPMVPGSPEFYEWLSSFDQYHAGVRWEHKLLARRLRETERPIRVLELGCGIGLFLKLLADAPNVSAVGIDNSHNSVEIARRNGIDARHMSLDEMIDKGERFDVVVLSHVLEHIPYPIETLKRIKALLEPGGSIVFSLPFSPMSREYPRWDVMNLPPHHLSRWSTSALKALADRLDMGLRYEVSKPKSALKRAMGQTWQTVVAPGAHPSRLARIALTLAHPASFVRVLRMHLGREKVNGRRAGDTALVTLSQNAMGAFERMLRPLSGFAEGRGFEPAQEGEGAFGAGEQGGQGGGRGAKVREPVLPFADDVAGAVGGGLASGEGADGAVEARVELGRKADEKVVV